MSREILQKLTADFDLHKFQRFFSDKNRKFKEGHESLDVLADSMFAKGQKLGTLSFEDGRLMVFAIEVKKELSERSGKRAQYELGKRILKNTQMDAGIFIFYNQAGSFRFSLIYANYLGKKRDWSAFRRFTYFVSKELSNKTFLQRIGDGDFSSLAKIKDAFSVEKVTKEFYQDIANWYFWAVENCQFPKDAEEEPTGRNIAVIRLITRMIFIWFMRERGLVPKGLFEESKVGLMLKKLPADESTYYLAILQNLFFATLSTKQEDRRFRSEVRGNKGINPDFGNQNVYRYHEYFRNPEKIEDYFSKIPFLNGGLFECLDDKPNGVYIDGFTATKKHQPEVPNVLFFSDDRKADLNAIYGTKGKTYKVKGLMNILSSYNFTIDENSLDDQDIALDPELLGRVFENLLASYNPETSTTARKATGSYYTPREIVDYMVTESLKAYFQTHLTEIEDLEKKLAQLFSAANNENPFTQKESNHVVDLIESVRIVDPAVGSGAFPMGALNKLVFILGKLDPGNELWKQAQLSAADTIPDPRVRKEAKSRIEEFFKAKNADYGRKLYLIQKCIYGVDIQEIAVEIAKLRFFISLLVDEKIDPQKENMGIEPLPNLDFKIMQGNSLISEFMGIDFDNGHDKKDNEGQGLLEIATPVDGLTKEFERKKIDFQNEPDRNKKAVLKKEIEDLMIEIFEARLKKKYAEIKAIDDRIKLIPNAKERDEYRKKEIAKLSRKLGFDLDNIEKQLRELTSKTKTKPFFPWKLYFAEVFEKGGFDAVIANPPYVSVKAISRQEKDTLSDSFETGEGRLNLFTVFIEKGHRLLRKNAVLTYIIPEGLYSNVEYRHIRKYILNNATISLVNLFSDRVFEAAVDTSIISILNKNTTDSCFQVYRDLRTKTIQLNQTIIQKFPYYLLPVNLTDQSWPIVEKLYKGNYSYISDILETQQGIIYSGQAKNKVFCNTKLNNTYKPVLDGRDVLKWIINWDAKTDNKFIHYTNKLHRPREERLFVATEKILLPRKSTRIQCAYDDSQFYALNTAYICLLKNDIFKLKYILACLNSKLINYYYSQLFFGWQVTIPALNSIPVKKASNDIQNAICAVVDRILAISKQGGFSDSLKLKRIHEYESQIDQMVYELYGLTPEEIAVVEGRNE